MNITIQSIRGIKMAKLVHAYEDESGEYYYKYLTTKDIDDPEVIGVLEAHAGEEFPYNIVQTGKIKPKVIDEDETEKEQPNEDGYYNKDQIDYEVIDRKNKEWEFIKQQGEETFNDLKAGKKFNIMKESPEA